ncbi:hypothetical protein [Salipiger bermudensis]|uniref:hypothetical protein n=1 Tax=Salipiger bermudensis TaxID=344736 RepID=UPI001185F5A1|nr:hypothetical protein [Salipiger bermudensis]
MQIDQGLAALVAAVIAAAAAVIATFSSMRATRLMSLLAARQNFIGQDLKDLSHYLYQVVALSVEAKKSKDHDAFNEKLRRAKLAAEALSELRIRHRYSLPFIFDAIWYLKGTPIYFEHYRNDRNNPQLLKIQRHATELREDLDATLENFFFHGKAPSYLNRRKLKNSCKRLERSFLAGKSGSRKKWWF